MVIVSYDNERRVGETKNCSIFLSFSPCLISMPDSWCTEHPPGQDSPETIKLKDLSLHLSWREGEGGGRGGGGRERRGEGGRGGRGEGGRERE